MKNFMFIIGILFLVGGCEKEIDPYEGESGIYFDTERMLLDTIEVPWGLRDTEIKSQLIKLKVLLFGEVKDYDRKFSVQVVHNEGDTLEAVPGKDYKEFTKEYVIPAHQAQTYIEIELLRDPILQKQPRCLTVILEAGDELGFPYSRLHVGKDSVLRKLDTRRIIKMTENFPKPTWWSNYGIKYFGTWSTKKSILICDKMNIARDIWLTIPNQSQDFTAGFLKYCGVFMHRWLQEQEPPIMDEDNKPMQMGKESQY